MSALRNTARAALGAPAFAVQHLSRLRHVDRSTRRAAGSTWALPPDTSRSAGSGVQSRADGCGPIVVRRYSVDIANASATTLLERLVADPNSFVPQHIAGFTIDGRRAELLRVGDEVLVEIPGPWNGPVRVDAIDATSMMLVTLDGHMEAGHIEFRVEPEDGGVLEFAITSWARAGDEAFEHAHLTTKVAAELQLAMWVHTCDRAVAVSGGSRRSPFRTVTEILEGTDIEC